jgi:hypothetical protein
MTETVWAALHQVLRPMGLWSRRGRIMKSVLVSDQLPKWGPRAFFNQGAWSDNLIELHPSKSTRGLKRIIRAAVESFRVQRLAGDGHAEQTTVDLLAAGKWQQTVMALKWNYPDKLTDCPKVFPAYDAPLCRIPKRQPGEFRTIAMTNLKQIAAGRSLLPVLNRMIDPQLPIHGFVPGRNPVTNARPHIGYGWSLSMDLESFFDHVTFDKLVRGGMPWSVARLITDKHGIARQGYATSPAASNVAFQAVDRAILELLKRGCREAVYTRYADDLTISANDLEQLNSVRAELRKIIETAGFKVCDRKTHLLCAKAGRRVITGVSVGSTDLRVPRAIRRRLRACEHAQNFSVADGLKEWSKLKEPSIAA